MSRSIVAAIEQLSYANLHPLKRGVEGARGPGWLHDCTWQAKTHLSCFALAWAKFSLTRALPLPVHLPANVPVNDCLPYLRTDWRANLSRIKQKLSTHTEMAECERDRKKQAHESCMPVICSLCSSDNSKESETKLCLWDFCAKVEATSASASTSSYSFSLSWP